MGTCHVHRAHALEKFAALGSMRSGSPRANGTGSPRPRRRRERVRSGRVRRPALQRATPIDARPPPGRRSCVGEAVSDHGCAASSAGTTSSRTSWHARRLNKARLGHQLRRSSSSRRGSLRRPVAARLARATTSNPRACSSSHRPHGVLARALAASIETRSRARHHVQLVLAHGGVVRVEIVIEDMPPPPLATK